MAALLPTSRHVLRVKWTIFDVVWAASAPYVALALSNAQILSADGIQAVAVYWLITVSFSLFAFAAFRLRDGMAHYFSVHDAIAIAKAVAVANRSPARCFSPSRGWTAFLAPRPSFTRWS